MKRKISDILDHCYDDSIDLTNSTPLSSQRIKELTMSKINHSEKKGRRIVSRILMAAAIIATLTMTAFAAEEIFGAGDIFRDILNEQLALEAEKDNLEKVIQETISEAQVEIINELGSSFQPQTQTSEGTTVTMAAAYGDAYILHLYMQVEAPEGTVLPDDIFYTFYDHNMDINYDDPDHWASLKPSKDAPYDSISRSIDMEPLPDEDPTDNKKDFHITIKGQPGTKPKFNDGYSKFFNMTGIYEQVPNVDGDHDGYVQLAPGEFSFDVGIINEVESVKLDVAGLTYGGYKTRTWTHDSPCLDLCKPELNGETDLETGLPIHFEDWNYEVTVKKMTLSSLSAEWEVEYTTDHGQMSFGLSFQVVMKDGTTAVEGTGGMGYSDNGRRTEGTTYFAVPIELDQVDYILIGDSEVGSTHKVYLP